MSGTTTFKSLELAGWSERADAYDRFTAALTGQVIEPLLDAAGVGSGQDVLDLCCGTGLVTAAALERGARVTAVDFAPSMIEAARRKGLAARFAVGDAEALRLPDASFDRVVCNCGLFHLADPDRAMAEARRVLRPGGRFGWSTWCGPERSPMFRVVLEAVAAAGGADVGLPPAPPPFRLAEPTQAERAMQAAGFARVTTAEVPAVLAWPLASIVDFLDRATVRVAMLLRAQEPAARRRIEELIVGGLAAHAEGGTVQAPMPSLVVVGTLP